MLVDDKTFLDTWLNYAQEKKGKIYIEEALQSKVFLVAQYNMARCQVIEVQENT